ncbi:MAG: hypothetical protein DBP02_15250 [gamma proteobacterium symbiont of Ctena orbiculata]|nr:MAG: hypothetical protein DBP02_15250 [gamma proteobacterium symbiont of Ctena orbiculata]
MRIVNIKNLIIVIPVVLLGCVGAPVKYVNGDFKIENSSDHQLIEETGKHLYFISTIYGTDEMKEEVSAIMEELRKRHPMWKWDKIESGQVSVGMTMDEVLLSWGDPTKTNHSSYGSQWVYRRGKSRAQYLYFRNGILEGFNES